jgi:L-cysteine S-thiosulfotransferase
MSQKNILNSVTFGLVAISLFGCTTTANQALFPTADQAVISSFKNIPEHMKGYIVQDQSQKLCSTARDKPSRDLQTSVENLNKIPPVVYPTNGKLVGDWQRGEKIAQSGYGMRKGDSVSRQPTGGNCYACHQLKPQELSYGTLGPSLLGYGKLRGNSEAVVKYTYDKIYNTQQFVGCSNMPRFGQNKILTPEQIADVVALLLDPNSPVNK